MKNYFFALLIQLVSLAVGFGLSFLIDITKLLGTYNSHGMGLQNLFLMTMIFGNIGALLNIYLFQSNKIIIVLSLLISVGLIMIS